VIAELEHPRRAGIIEIYTPELKAVVMSDDKIVWGNWFEYKVSDKTGQKTREIIMDYRPIPITEEFKEKFIKELSGLVPLSRKVEFPEYHPSFRAMSCDEKGRIFIRTSEQTEDEKGYYYDILYEKGRYMAKLPLEFLPHIWKNKRLYSVEEDV
jgi:hypothetical protein